jgi:hypothetical protein
VFCDRGIDELFSGDGGGDLLLLTLINFQNTSLLLLYFWQKSCSIDKSPLLSNEMGDINIVTLFPDLFQSSRSINISLE